MINGNIFDSKVFDQHMLIFLSSISNELINTCSCTKIFTEALDFLKKNFTNGALTGLLAVIGQLWSHGLANWSAFLVWNAGLLGSILTFQFYYIGFSFGKILRIFFYGMP